jgi:hypothetical protein
MFRGERPRSASAVERSGIIPGDVVEIQARRFGMSKRLVVVGGGAGGPSAAAKAKRLDSDLEVTILEAGEHVSFAT